VRTDLLTTALPPPLTIQTNKQRKTKANKTKPRQNSPKKTKKPKLVGFRERAPCCKVADFGLSKRKQATFVSGVTSLRGTLPWIAPEVVRTPAAVDEQVCARCHLLVFWGVGRGLGAGSPRHTPLAPPHSSKPKPNPIQIKSTNNEKVDVYSFGVVMWELWALREPFEARGGVLCLQGLNPRPIALP
jgi:serine/threonine protein kinase